VEAMDFLRRHGSHSDAPRPALVLLDLNLPRMDGREVLARIKLDDDLKAIPTVILSASDVRADIDSTYQLQANCYLTKPLQLDDLDRMVRCINDFWLSNVAALSKAVH